MVCLGHSRGKFESPLLAREWTASAHDDGDTSAASRVGCGSTRSLQPRPRVRFSKKRRGSLARCSSPKRESGAGGSSRGPGPCPPAGARAGRPPDRTRRPGRVRASCPPWRSFECSAGPRCPYYALFQALLSVKYGIICPASNPLPGASTLPGGHRPRSRPGGYLVNRGALRRR
jgi:hypothetical protein